MFIRFAAAKVKRFFKKSKTRTMNKKNNPENSKPDMTQLMMLFTLVVGGGLILTEEQIGGIVQILLSAVAPLTVPSVPAPKEMESPDIISGYAALSAFTGFSIPTCVKMSKEGRFDAAALDFGGGTRKKMWDRAKLIEIARKKK